MARCRAQAAVGVSLRSDARSAPHLQWCAAAGSICNGSRLCGASRSALHRVRDREIALSIDAAAASACVKGRFRGIFVKRVTDADAAAAYWVGAWRTFREMTQKSLHDDHTARFASRPRRSRQYPVPAMKRSGKGERRMPLAWPIIADQNPGEMNEVDQNLGDRACHVGPACRPRAGARHRHPTRRCAAARRARHHAKGRGTGAATRNSTRSRARPASGPAPARSQRARWAPAAAARPRARGGAAGDSATGGKALLAAALSFDAALRRQLRPRRRPEFFMSAALSS